MNLESFDLIDRVRELGPRLGWLTCHSLLPRDARLYEGHFPGYPLVPGTVQTEMMAQAAGLLSLARDGCRRMPRLVGLERARFRQELLPGASVSVRATHIYDSGRLLVADCRLSQEAELISQVEVRLTLGPFPSARVEAYFQDLVDRTGARTLIPEIAADVQS